MADIGPRIMLAGITIATGVQYFWIFKKAFIANISALSGTRKKLPVTSKAGRNHAIKHIYPASDGMVEIFG